MVKTKVLAILEQPFKAGKKEGSGIIKLCVQYPGGDSGVHAVYNDLATLRLIKVGDSLDLGLKYEEFAFMEKAA